MKNFRQSAIALSVASVLFSAQFSAHAQQQNDNEQDVVITVSEKRDDQLSSKQTIDSEQIKNTPSTNGNLSDYLKSNPNVRLNHEENEGFQGGEIKPASVSINGADSSQTAYFVDGINFNNDIDPDSDVWDGSMQVMPGRSSEQGYFLDANLLSGIEVYDSNVPAKFGGFTGGAVVAQTKQYAGQDGAQLRYRTTRSSWASMQVDQNAKSSLDKITPNGFSADFQPDYKKDFYSIAFEKGLTDDLGLVVGFSRRESDIKQKRVINIEGEIDSQDHTRRSDNWLANLNWQPDVNKNLQVGFRLSDYQEGKYHADNHDNNLTDSHSAYGSTIKWNQYLGNGWLTATAAYDRLIDKRESNSRDVVSTIDVSTELNFENGGYGKSELTQKTLNLGVDYEFDSIKWLETTHDLTMGLSRTKTDYDFKRYNPVSQKILVLMSEFDMVLQEQSSVTRAGTVSTGYTSYAAYIEDVIKWRNFSFRPGLRVERDDYLENTNWSPRFAANWQVLPQTRLNIGLNRYFGRSFASMKLAGEVLELNDDHTRDYKSIKNLKTPHAEEYTFGIDQMVGNFTVAARYTLRKNKDSIKTKRYEIGGTKVDAFENQPDFEVDIYTLQASNVKPWILGPTQWTTTFAADYLLTDRVDADKKQDPNEQVFLDNKPMTYAQMKRAVNSSAEEWMLRFGIDMYAEPIDLVWSNNISVKAPRRGAEHQSDNRYKSYDFGSQTQWDTRLRWQPSIYASHQVYVQLDVQNVLNQVRQTSVGRSNDGDFGYYTPGRQYWLELGYEF